MVSSQRDSPTDLFNTIYDEDDLPSEWEKLEEVLEQRDFDVTISSPLDQQAVVERDIRR